MKMRYVRDFLPQKAMAAAIFAASRERRIRSSTFRICPVPGCTAVPVKRLKKHLRDVHPQIPPELAAQLLRTAAVFRVPRGKEKRELVVRRGGKRGRLQLARKSTGSFSWEVEGPTPREGGGDLSDGSCYWGRDGEDREMCVRDSAIQCDLLPPGFLAPLHRAVCTSRSLPAGEGATHRSLPAGEGATHRPQYARKSTAAERLQRREGSPKQSQLAPSSLSTSLEIEGCGASVGEPCELMCKLGNWDVIFYETPPFIPSPSHSPHPPNSPISTE